MANLFKLIYNEIVNFPWDAIKKEFSENLMKIRKTKELSQEKVAGIELGVRNYQKIEKGDTYPSFKSIVIISKNLEVHPAKLFDLPSLNSLIEEPETLDQ